MPARVRVAWHVLRDTAWATNRTASYFPSAFVGAIETAEQFGPRIYAEAVRRGLKRAKRIVVLGDGAPWIWNIADEHFHGTLQIVDLYHARQHFAEIGKIVYGPASTKAKDWAAGRALNNSMKATSRQS